MGLSLTRSQWLDRRPPPPARKVNVDEAVIDEFSVKAAIVGDHCGRECKIPLSQ